MGSPAESSSSLLSAVHSGAAAAARALLGSQLAVSEWSAMWREGLSTTSSPSPEYTLTLSAEYHLLCKMSDNANFCKKIMELKNQF